MKSKNIFVKIMLLILATITMMSFVGCSDESDLIDRAQDLINGISNKTDESNFAVGETITFGHYEQDNDTSNGKEEIEWIVLAKEDGKIFVTSKYALDDQPYGERKGSVTWETCSLRTWLNSTFLNDAFSSAEKSKIATTTVVNDDNLKCGTDGGDDTQDKVFLLSRDEAEKYLSSSEARELQGTEYAKANGLWHDADSDSCTWWLRSIGDMCDGGMFAVLVDEYGCVEDRDNSVASSLGIRPAMWINI